MARISLTNLRHTYREPARDEADWALKRLDLNWEAGSANALLGPSGCGKTTLLNIISGLLQPTEGTVRFGERDVTALPPDERNIAQVFQFPVVYDTMSVYDNLAFPLRNRGIPQPSVDARVREVAEMLELSGQLEQRAAGLSADVKQKISLGRGLVRNDVSAVLFDEPLTVIDPHLKWQLRRKLKQIHRELKLTLIYVTHDQVEALTFADQVIVMTQGKAVQTGTPDELFERPQHTFVGHFIGSPGMNFLDAQVVGEQLQIGDSTLSLPAGRAQTLSQAGRTTVGVRPEFVALSDSQDSGAVPAIVSLVKDIGTHWMISATVAGRVVRARVAPDVRAPQVGDTVWLAVIGPHTCFYKDDRLIA